MCEKSKLKASAGTKDVSQGTADFLREVIADLRFPLFITPPPYLTLLVGSMDFKEEDLRIISLNVFETVEDP
jgi:hypothetical protein